jgi:hypothetical protein
MNPVGPGYGLVRQHKAADNNMTYENNRKIGGEVVSPLMGKVLITYGTMVNGLQERSE